jgi:hypothetical protein
MKNYIRLLLLAAVVILSVTALIGQTKDIVYLKNGSVIKGTILEMIPDKTIKIQTSDGNIFVYKMAEVEKIGKDSTAPVPEQKQAVEQPAYTPQPQRTYESQRTYQGQSGLEGMGVKVSIYGGAALPVGNFQKSQEDGGFGAKVGWTAGGQLVVGGSLGFILDGSFSLNKWDLPMSYTQSVGKYEWGGYISVLGLAGIKIGTDNADGFNIFIAPLVGGLYSKTPEVTYTSSGPFSSSSTWIPSGTGIALAYGGTLEVILGGHVTFSGKYIASKPKYKMSWNGEDVTGDPVNFSLAQVCVGIAF